MKKTCAAFVFLIQTLQCLASDDSPFQLTNRATGFCLVKTNNHCDDVRWTTGNRLLVQQRKKCLGAQGKSVGSEINLYDCDENNELQKWECKNETVLALKDQELYIQLTADNTAVLSRTVGPNNHLTISATSSGACTRTYRVLYTIAGNAAGIPCMFPFKYKNQWYADCIIYDSPEGRLWCAAETQYETERWGYCPITSKEGWNVHPVTGAYYQLNTQSALTWPQAETSCKQQGASMVSITDPHQRAYVIALLGAGGSKLWTGLILDPEHGWKWSNGRPYSFMKWDSGHPLPNPGYNCAIFDPAVQYSWQSTPCSKKFGYICYSVAAENHLMRPSALPAFCSTPWIPYNGHCFYLNKTEKTWSDAQTDCRKGGGDLVSIQNVEDQSFVISQLGYVSNDKLWIGLNDRKTEGLFDWIDHSTVTFTSWAFNKPDMSSEIKDCVIIQGENGNWADCVCDEKHGSICMKQTALKFTGDQVEQDAGCKAGWRRHGSYCYFIATVTKTFEEAKDQCKSSNSNLADVSSGVDNAFLVSLVGMRPEKHFWLGLSNQRDIWEFLWTNMNSVRFTHWNAGMPGHRQGCVAMTTGFFAGLWDVLPCTNKEKYICKHLAEGTALTPAPTTAVPYKCADGWTELKSRNNCFKRFYEGYSEQRTWYQARDFCRDLGGDLLSIHSAADIKLLQRWYEPSWIGLSAPDPATGYVWSDGSSLQFQHWEEGEPNNENNVESCVEMQLLNEGYHGSWNDKHCEKYNGWHCQIRRGLIPKRTKNNIKPEYNKTSDGWLIWNGNQYYFNQRRMVVEDARQSCQKSHGDLVTINSEAENIFLWKQISKRSQPYWIGLNVELDKTYEWMDGSAVMFQRWDQNRPSLLNNDENCAMMTAETGIGTSSVVPSVSETPCLPQFCSFWIPNIKDQSHYCFCGNPLDRCNRLKPCSTTSPLLFVLPLGTVIHESDGSDTTGAAGKLQMNLTWRIVHVLRDRRFWQDHSCGFEKNSICKRNTSKHARGTVPPIILRGGCPQNWLKLDSKCYKILYNQRETWNGSRTQCKKMGGNLASILSRHEQVFLTMRMEEAPDTNLWIGLSNNNNEFYWTDGRPIRYTNWGLRHNSYYNKKLCAVMTTNLKSGFGKWTKQTCSETAGYICLRNVDPSIQDSTEPTTYTNYVKIFNDTIKIVTQPMTWDAARKNCEGDGAQLASLQNMWSQTYSELMALTVNGPLWIGMNKDKTGGYFRFIDGRRLNITAWGPHEPGKEPCVYVDTDGKWKTAKCNQKKKSICMETTGVPPTESSDFPGLCPESPDQIFPSRNTLSWIKFKGYCYLFSTEKTQWSEGSVECIKHGAKLVSIEEPAEQTFIQNVIKAYQDSHSSFWIGLYKTHKGLMRWLDESQVDYTNFADESYNNGYAAIRSEDGVWAFSSRWDHKSFICKAPKVILQAPPTTIKPTVELQTNGHWVSRLVLIVALVAMGTIIILYVLKKFGRRLLLKDKFTPFDNERSRHNDTNELTANA